MTVTATKNSGFAANTLHSIRFDEIRLAEVTASGQTASAAPLTGTYSAGTTQASFQIRRTAAGALLTRFTVTDDCGIWPTFVGAGPTAGW